MKSWRQKRGQVKEEKGSARRTNVIGTKRGDSLSVRNSRIDIVIRTTGTASGERKQPRIPMSCTAGRTFSISMLAEHEIQIDMRSKERALGCRQEICAEKTLIVAE